MSWMKESFLLRNDGELADDKKSLRQFQVKLTFIPSPLLRKCDVTNSHHKLEFVSNSK